MTKGFRRELLKQLVTLSTSGFGVVAALAWNEAIQTFINDYIVGYLTIGSGLASKFIYAILVTTFAVLVTYQLSMLVREEEKK
ncbi:MAG: DUF5654 family protein [Candidatus Curtissbacteria bacterium]|nr:DUF5654 family protein [Candidatus Curtissbacteria bacterium]